MFLDLSAVVGEANLADAAGIQARGLHLIEKAHYAVRQHVAWLDVNAQRKAGDVRLAK